MIAIDARVGQRIPLVFTLGLSLLAAGPLAAKDPLPSEAITPPVDVTPIRFAEDPGAAERIEEADRLRTLSQEIASAACHLHNGVLPDESRTLLLESKHDFMNIIAALRHGDAEKKITGEETDRRVLADLDKLEEVWAPVEDALFTLLDTPGDVAAVTAIKAQSDPLHKLADHLLGTLNDEYGNPMDLLQVDAILLDIVGRQAMLTQKIAKEACEIWTGNRSEERLAALESSASTFELGIGALHDGMPELGIKPAPTPGIKTGLERVMLDWEIVQEELHLVRQGTLDEAGRADLYHRLNVKMKKLEELAHLYTIFSKHDHSGPSGG